MMLDAWRLIDSETTDPYLNMAIEEAILMAVGKGEAPPTIRFWRNSPAIVIGYFQEVEREAYVDECCITGTEIVRRISGGGSVYHDLGNLNYSIFMPNHDPHAIADIDFSYACYCKGLIRGLTELGLRAEFAPVNDVVVDGRKVSGTAQARRHRAILHHGTLMVDVDILAMNRVLLVAPDYLASKGAACLRDWVVTLRELGACSSVSEAKEALRRGFEQVLKVRFVEEALSDNEESHAQRLLVEQYSRDSWNFMR
jgi:lipoate---protein ligase